MTKASDKAAIATDKAGQRIEIPADTVVLSFGFKPRDHAFQNLVPNVYIIGDAKSPKNLKQAIHDGFNVAIEI